jgi:choline dehydrogenase-like flavoprotein
MTARDGHENGTSVPGLPVPTKYERNYNSVPQAGLNNRSAPLYTGAVVGGGTVVNGMFFNRGSAVDYDAWEALGNPGWGWEGLLPYFKKVSNCIGDVRRDRPELITEFAE